MFKDPLKIAAGSWAGGGEIGVAVRERKRIGVVLPVGPKDAEAALDTLASALYYLDESRVIVVVDDSGRPAEFAARVRELSPEIVVRPAPPRAPARLRCADHRGRTRGLRRQGVRREPADRPARLLPDRPERPAARLVMG